MLEVATDSTDPLATLSRLFSSDSMIFSMEKSELGRRGRLTRVGSGMGLGVGSGAGAGSAVEVGWLGHWERKRGSTITSPYGPSKTVPQQIRFLETSRGDIEF